MADKSISFIRSLCAGEIEEKVLFRYPQMDPEEAELTRSVIEAVDSLLEGREEDFRAWEG